MNKYYFPEMGEWEREGCGCTPQREGKGKGRAPSHVLPATHPLNSPSLGDLSLKQGRHLVATL